MGRVWALVFAFLGTEQPINDYDSRFHRDVHVFAEKGLKKAYKSSVIINAFSGGDNNGVSTGSGNYMKVDGKKFILTALHVVDGKHNIYVTEKSGVSYIATVKYIDAYMDIAILEVDQNLNYTKAIEYTTISSRPMGREVFYCGHPNYSKFLTFEGRINGTDEQWLTLDIFAWPGSSGSVVFDKDGNAIGVVSAVSISAPTGFTVLVPNIVRIGSTTSLSREKIMEILSE